MWARGMRYKAAEHTVLLYGSKSWVVTGVMLKHLEVFYHRSAWRIIGMMSRRVETIEWEYPPVADFLETMGL